TLSAIVHGQIIDLSSQEAAEQSRASMEQRLVDPAHPGLVKVLLTVKAAEPEAETEAEGEARIEMTPQRRLEVHRNHFGNIRVSVLDQAFVSGPEYGILHDAATTFENLVSEESRVERGEGDKRREQKVKGFREAIQWLRNEAERSLSKQRYKGLGEMNPEQLWETTMDPQVRRLMRVKIEDAISADEIFTTLMGDHVEPRRAFIEQHAKLASNLDV